MTTLNSETIDALLNGKAIVEDLPWSSYDDDEIKEFYRGVIKDIKEKCSLLDKTEYDHYGSGYASFIDCFLYREDESFRFREGNSFNGLNVLLSRLSKYYVLGSAQKTWRDKSASSTMPHFDSVDKIEEVTIQKIVPCVNEVLEGYGLIRLQKEQLSELLPTEDVVPTILSDRPWCYFDALFYWVD